MLSGLVERFIAPRLAFHPVDATFMGLGGHDHKLPPTDAEGQRASWRSCVRSSAKPAPCPPSATAAERREATVLEGQISAAIRELGLRPRYHDPA